MMIAEYSPKTAVVIEKVDYMRKEIDIVTTILGQTHSLQIVLLYEEINDSDVDRRLYGYKIGEMETEKPLLDDEDASIDWGSILFTDIYDWYDGTYAFSTDAEIKEMNTTVEEVFSDVWDTLENEYLV